MFTPRQTQLAQAQAMTCFHLWSRVEPAAGAGFSADALKVYAAKLLKRLGQAYAVRLQGFSIENDRFHLVLHWVPGEAAGWSDEEAVKRWRMAHPLRFRDHLPHGDEPLPQDETDPQAEISMPSDPATIRRKLANLSRFMQQFKQLLSRKVNRMAGRKGPLWQGRFKLAQVKDASELAGVLAFIDLRAVAKGGGTRPEEAPFTSIHTRVATYKGKFGMPPFGPLGQPGGEWQPLPAEVAAELREGPLPPWDHDAPPSPSNPEPASNPMPDPSPMPAMPDIPPMGGDAPPPPFMPAMPMMPGMAFPPVDMPPPMDTGSSVPMPISAMPAPGNPGSSAFPQQPRFPWLLALREDERIPGVDAPADAAPVGMLAWLPLHKYLKLLDTLVEKAKAWPHLPGDAPGRAPAPPTPAWEGALEVLLAGLGLRAAGFEAQWQRLATLRG